MAEAVVASDADFARPRLKSSIFNDFTVGGRVIELPGANSEWAFGGGGRQDKIEKESSDGTDHTSGRGFMRPFFSMSLLALTVLAACSQPSGANGAAPASDSRSAPPAADTASTPADASAAAAGATGSAGSGTARRPGGGLIAEPSGVEGVLSITIRWSARTVVGKPEEGQTTTVYNRIAQLECPVTSSDATPYSYFAALDNPNGDPLAETGAYQPWFNEECAGTLTIDDTYHFDDPTIAGPEPVVSTTGTRPLETSDTPLTVETDLNRARTRYLFISPSADGFQQHAAEGYPAKLVSASAAPMATMDFTLEGPIGDGKQEVTVEGGKLNVDWTFIRGRPKP